MTENTSLNLPDEDDRLAQIRADWHVEHNAAHRKPITREMVFEIAYRLIAADQQPTVNAINYVNGSGSPNTIQPALKDFFLSGELLRRWHKPTISPDVPAPLQRLWQDAVSTAREVIEAEFQAARAALHARERDLDVRENEVSLKINQDRARHEEMQRRQKDLHTRVTSELRAHRVTRRAHDQTLAAMGLLITRADRADEALANEQTDHKALRICFDADAAQARTSADSLRHRIAELMAEVGTLKDQVADLEKDRSTLRERARLFSEEVTKSRLESERQLATIASLHASLAELAEAHTQTKLTALADAAALQTGHRQSCDALNAKVTLSAVRAAEIGAELNAAQASLKHVEESLAIARVDASQWQDQARETLARMSSLEAEIGERPRSDTDHRL